MRGYRAEVIKEALKRGVIDLDVAGQLASTACVESALERGWITESTVQMLDDIQYELNHENDR